MAGGLQDIVCLAKQGAVKAARLGMGENNKHIHPG
jgi:hypothetical protein